MSADRKARPLLDPAIIRRAVVDAFVKLDPRREIRNPVWFTVLFANFAEAMAEGRGKAQADALRKARKEVTAKRLSEARRTAKIASVPATALRKGDFVLIEAGDYIPADGEVVEGIASVDE